LRGPMDSSSSASTNVSSVIGSSRVLQVEVRQLHLSRLRPMATSTTPQPYTADRPENSTTSVDANLFDAGGAAVDDWEYATIDWEHSSITRRGPNLIYTLVGVPCSGSTLTIGSRKPRRHRDLPSDGTML